jgi:glutamine amidotransferase-like uncharacterized protein
MGRYYDGTIYGKFWFGVQSSYDANNFKQDDFITPSEYYEYFNCSCIVKNLEELYCINCYKSYEDHLGSTDDYDKDCIEEGLLALPSGHVEYEFNKSELNFIHQKLKSLELIIGDDNIKKLNFKIENESEYFEYNITFDNNDDNKNELIARYCFGKQIEAALVEIGECYINCEI